MSLKAQKQEQNLVPVVDQTELTNNRYRGNCENASNILGYTFQFPKIEKVLSNVAVDT